MSNEKRESNPVIQYVIVSFMSNLAKNIEYEARKIQYENEKKLREDNSLDTDSSSDVGCDLFGDDDGW